MALTQAMGMSQLRARDGTAATYRCECKGGLATFP